MSIVCGLAVFALGRRADSVAAPKVPPVTPDQIAYLSDASERFFRSVLVNGEVWLVQNPHRGAHFAERQVFPAEKRPDAKRVVLVGESSGLFFGDKLRGLLAQGPYGPQVEFVNCGVSAAGLEQVESVFDEVAGYGPDAVVVFFGNNLMTVRPSLRSLPFRLARLIAGNRFLSKRNARALEEIRLSERLGMWEGFVRKAARTARRKKFRLIVSTVQGNLMWPSPPVPRLPENGRFLAAQYDHYSGRRAEAIDALTRLVRDRPNPYWAHTLGEWLYREGRFDDARRTLTLAADGDAAPRANSGFNEATRRLAAEEGFELFDEAAWVAGRSANGIPGWDMFNDDCHLTERAFERAAFELLKQLQGTGFFPPAPDWAPRFEAPLEDTFGHYISVRVVSADPPAAPSVMAVTGRMREAVLNGRPFHDNHIGLVLEGPGDARTKAAVAYHAAEAYFQLGRREDAFRMNGRAAELQSDWPEPYVQRALFLLSGGHGQEACGPLRSVLRAQPDHEAAAYFAERVGCR